MISILIVSCTAYNTIALTVGFIDGNDYGELDTIGEFIFYGSFTVLFAL